jgi:N utilization substance protein B
MAEVKVDQRHLARLLAVQYLFTKNFSEKISTDASFYEPNALLDELEDSKYDTRLYEALVDGVIESQEALDKRITELAPAWPIDQINPVDLIILRCAIWESQYFDKTPYKVVINEAIELAKELGSEKNGKFINGVLGSLLEKKNGKSK